MREYRSSWRSCLLACAVMLTSVFTAGFTASAAASPAYGGYELQRAVAPLVAGLEAFQKATAPALMPANVTKDVLGSNMVRTSAHRPAAAVPLSYMKHAKTPTAGLGTPQIEGGVGQYRS